MVGATSMTLGTVPETIIGVTCCNANGVGSRPGCKTGNYFTAKTHCEANGKTLCTLAQIQAGAGQGTGCFFDDQLVWTSDICGLPKTYALARTLTLTLTLPPISALPLPQPHALQHHPATI